MNPLDVLSTLVAVFVPLFVAMDPVGALPLIVAWTGNLAPAERERQLRDGLLTALALGLLFVIGGRWLLSVLGVGVADFLVAGGLVLLILVDRYGLPLALIALLANLLIAWRLFRRAGLITRLLGRNGLRAASKVASLLLAAIAVRLIREGLGTFLETPSS